MIDTPFFHDIETKPHFLLLPLFQSIFSMTVWNTIDDKYSNSVLYIVTKPHFLIFASFESLFSMTVWNTIDETYSVVPLYRNKATFLDLAPFEIISACQCGIVSMIHTPFLHYIETKPHFLLLSIFQSIFSMTVWNTIDDRYSIFPRYRNEATFLAFAPFSEHFQYDSVEYYR